MPPAPPPFSPRVPFYHTPLTTLPIMLFFNPSLSPPFPLPCPPPFLPPPSLPFLSQEFDANASHVIRLNKKDTESMVERLSCSQSPLRPSSAHHSLGSFVRLFVCILQHTRPFTSNHCLTLSYPLHTVTLGSTFFLASSLQQQQQHQHHHHQQQPLFHSQPSYHGYPMERDSSGGEYATTTRSRSTSRGRTGNHPHHNNNNDNHGEGGYHYHDDSRPYLGVGGGGGGDLQSVTSTGSRRSSKSLLGLDPKVSIYLPLYVYTH